MGCWSGFVENGTEKNAFRAQGAVTIKCSNFTSIFVQTATAYRIRAVELLKSLQMFCICTMAMIIVIFIGRCLLNSKIVEILNGRRQRREWCEYSKTKNKLSTIITMLQYSVTHVNTHDEFATAAFFLLLLFAAIFVSRCLQWTGLTQWRVHNNFSVLRAHYKRYALENIEPLNLIESVHLYTFAFLCAIFYCLVCSFYI